MILRIDRALKNMTLHPYEMANYMGLKIVIDYINSFDPDVVISSNSLIFPEQLHNQENITFIK